VNLTTEAIELGLGGTTTKSRHNRLGCRQSLSHHHPDGITWVQFESRETAKPMLTQSLYYQTQVGARIESPFNQRTGFGVFRIGSRNCFNDRRSANAKSEAADS
jgi:hypothetical protein